MSESDPDAALRRINDRLRVQRVAQGLDPETGRPATATLSLSAPVVQQGSSSGKLKRWSEPGRLAPGTFVRAEPEDPSEYEYRCTEILAGERRCGTPIPFPGVCAVCANRELAAERQLEVQARIKTHLPGLFHSVTWETLPTLKNKTKTGPLVALPHPTFEEMHEAFKTEPCVVLIGPTGAAKSFIAACHIREMLDGGMERAWFIPSVLLEENVVGLEAYNRALYAEELVLDDLLAELHTATAESGVAAQRVKLSSKLLALRYNAGRRIMVTTPHEDDFLNKFYGDGNIRKVFDGARKFYIGMKKPAQTKR